MNVAAAIQEAPLPSAPLRAFSADSIRIPRGVALALCGACPEALSALCRVLWHCRVSGICFASAATLRQAGLPLSPAVLTRGLRALLDRGLLASGMSMERGTTHYAPTEELARTEDSVFIPPEVWRGCKPTELALWVAWRLSHGYMGPEQLGQQIAGRGGKSLSRRQSYAVFSTLRSRCLIQCGGSAKNEVPPVRKTMEGWCEKLPTNTDPLNTDFFKTEEQPVLARLHCSCGRWPGAVGVGQSLSLVPAEPPSSQLSFPFGGPLRVVEALPVVLIDWSEAAGALRAAAPVHPASAETGRQPAQRPPTPPAPEAAARPALLSSGFWPAFVSRCGTAWGMPEKSAKFYAAQGLVVRQPEHAQLTAGALEAVQSGYTEAEIMRLADFIRLGGVGWRKGVWQHVSRNFIAELTKALDPAWDGKSDPRIGSLARAGSGRQRIGTTCRVEPGTVTITKGGVTETKPLSDFKAPDDGSVF